jgi:U3 small nucleolar RNA-associated protein MPP10
MMSALSGVRPDPLNFFELGETFDERGIRAFSNTAAHCSKAILHLRSIYRYPTMATTENPLLALLATNPHPLLQPSTAHNAAALSLAKLYLDPLAQSLSALQTTRQQENRKKRKRGTREDAEARPLALKKLHVEGFGVDQVHEQVRRVIEAAKREVRVGLEGLERAEVANGVGEGSDVDSDEEELLEDEGFHTEDDEEVEDDEEEASDAEVNAMDDDNEDIEDIEAEDEGEDEDMEDGSLDDDNAHASEFVQDVHGLNDGFFSIDDFNRQAEFLERADLNNQDDGAASDEEDVDWSADPMSMNRPKAVNGTGDDDSDAAEDNDDDEGGPTFGDMDINAPEGFSDDDDDGDAQLAEDADMDDLNDFGNANNIMYRDFFAPPARKASDRRGGKRGPPMKHNFPKASAADNEAEITRMMAAHHRDLFSDEEGVEGEDDDLSEVDEFDPKARRSNHERRQAKILQEIRKLEAENVAKREWTMSGEARAVDRPHNSLLEEDLDFERVGKPVPVITQEVTEDIESLIRRRILAREFDEVLRRRPDELLAGALGRRGRIDEEVSDAKSKKGLAELYEEDHLRRTDPGYLDARDEKLKTAHREIENLWREIADKLDSLSSWHYRPKPVEMSVQVRTDAPVISMEDARPSGIGGEMAETNQLAPQEVYKAGAEKAKGEVVTKGGEVVAREEMSREVKKSRRARQKERAKKEEENKARPVAATSGGEGKGAKRGGKGNKKAERTALVGDLKKGGVMVIGRKGEVVDVEGKEVKGKKALSAGGLRL